MSPVKRLEGEKHSSIVICEGIANNCNELKTTQLLKDEDENQPHSPIIKETKTSPLQISPNSNFTSSDKDKMFSSHYELGSIEKSEKDATETAASSIQIHLSSEIKREETDEGELPESLNDGENQLTSTVFQTSKTSEIQEPSCPPVTSCYKDEIIFPFHYEHDTIKKCKKNGEKTEHSSVQIYPSAEIKEEETSVSPFNDNEIFSSHHEIYSIEKEEEIGTETADSSVRKLLSLVIKRVETSIAEPRTNLNYVENQLHYLDFQISKTSPTTSSSIVMPFNEDKILSSDLVINFIENSEKNDSENTVSSAQKHLSSTVKKKKKRVCKSRRNLNNVENQPPSIVFQLSKSSPMQTTLSSTVTTSNEEQKFSFQRKTRSTQHLQKNVMETVSSSVQAPLCSRIKSVKNIFGDFAKNLGLLELKNKSNSSQVKTDRRAKKRATKRKSSVNSASPSPNCKKIASSIIQDPNVLHPSRMKLKSIVLIPTPKKADTSFVVDDGIYPRFANIDPSKVLSSLNRQANITKSLACGKAISLFFPGGFTSQEKTSERYNLSSNQKPIPLYKFKKANFGPLHLSKKYPMLDSFTMDKCYGKLFSFPKLLK